MTWLLLAGVYFLGAATPCLVAVAVGALSVAVASLGVSVGNSS